MNRREIVLITGGTGSFDSPVIHLLLGPSVVRGLRGRRHFDGHMAREIGATGRSPAGGGCHAEARGQHQRP
jgi:hypothetical protein